MEIALYEDISAGAAAKLRDALTRAGRGPLTLRLSSSGGDVFEGLAIYNMLAERGNVTVRIDGLAASIASVIAMAGVRVEMAENALMMVHDPWATTTGRADDLRRNAELLDRAKGAMLGAYVRKTGKPEATIARLLSAETWLTAQEAVAEGFADAVYAATRLAARLDLSQFPNAPQRILTMSQLANTPTTTAPIEAATVDATAQAVLAQERNRRAEIRARVPAIYASRPEIREILDAALDDPAITADQVAARVLATLGQGAEPINRQPASAGAVTWGENRHHDQFRAAATDALLLRAGIQVANPHPGARDVRGMSLVQIAGSLLTQQGRGFVGESPHAVLKASMTTSDFPLLLAGVASKALMRGYEDEPASHRAWVQDVEVSNFKPQSRVAISEAPALEMIPEAGEYTQGALTERSESYQLATYGRILALTRQAIINDDIGGFTRIPQAFGASAARKEADVVYNLLTANPVMSDGVALFNAAHGNLASNGAALSVSSLGAAKAAMRLQRGIGGLGVLNVVPRFLIVPAALETVADQLLAALVDPSKSNATDNPAWVRGLQLVVEPRLDAHSATAWYLAASWQQVDTVEMAHLNGQRGVFTDEETDFATDTWRIKARLDFAAQVIDWVGLYKNPGAAS